MQISCIMCASCVDACAEVMGKKNKKSLISYRFGSLSSSASLRELFRPTVLFLGILVLVGVGWFFYQISLRSSFDFEVLAHGYGVRFNKSGEVVNGYVLSVKNMSKDDLTLQFFLSNIDESVSFNHSLKEELIVPAGIVSRFPLFVRSMDVPDAKIKLQFNLQNSNDSTEKSSRKINFRIP